MMLWTGGKDSSLAFYRAKLSDIKVKGLVTFIPNNSEFLAHPISFMKYQAQALGLPHYLLKIDEPFKENYENAILHLKERDRIDTLITGDIAEVDGLPNWIRERSEYSNVNVLTPLWGCDRFEVIDQFLSYKFKAIFSCVKKPYFTEEWLGMELDKDSFKRLRAISAETGLDICGERGEYHTLVVDGPPFKKKIHINAYSKCKKNGLMYIDIQKLELRE